MSPVPSDLQSNLGSIEAAGEEIESYLLSNETFRSPSGRETLSLGSIGLKRRALDAQRDQLEPKDGSRLEAAEAKLDATHERWRVAWERKAANELRARLNLWRSYLGELENRPGLGSSYPQEVHSRAMATDLLLEAGNQPEVSGLSASLDAIDDRLRSYFQSGSFVWDGDLESAFPQEEYWFLYGRPGLSDSKPA